MLKKFLLLLMLFGLTNKIQASQRNPFNSLEEDIAENERIYRDHLTDNEDIECATEAPTEYKTPTEKLLTVLSFLKETMVKLSPSREPFEQELPDKKIEDVEQALPEKSIKEAEQAALPDKKIEGKYDCPDCNYKAVSNSKLTRHIVKHTQEKPFKCRFPLCRKKYAQKTDLKNHLLKIHNYCLSQPKKRKAFEAEQNDDDL